jgi:hypothetical protein
MKATLIALPAMLLLGSAAFAAESGGDGPPAACKADMDKLCAGMTGDAQMTCLEGKIDQASEACQNALDAGTDPAPMEEDAPADAQN